MDDRFASLSSLPIRTRPCYSMAICVPKLTEVVSAIEAVLYPPFWRKMLGGISKDHARAVIAALEEDLGALQKVINNARLSAEAIASGGEAGAMRNMSALAGYCARLSESIKEWRKAADEFCAAAYNSRNLIESRTSDLSRTSEAVGKAIGNLSD